MSTATLPRTQPAETGGDHDLHHYVCCDPNIAKCGLDVTDHPYITSGPGTRYCPLCTYLEDHGQPCTVPTCPVGRMP